MVFNVYDMKKLLLGDRNTYYKKRIELEEKYGYNAFRGLQKRAFNLMFNKGGDINDY